MSQYFDTNIATTVLTAENKRLRVLVRKQVPYVVYKRKTRVLFMNDLRTPFINVHGDKIVLRA